MIESLPGQEFVLEWSSSAGHILELASTGFPGVILLSDSVGVEQARDFLVRLRDLTSAPPVVVIGDPGKDGLDSDGVALGAGDFLVRDEVTPALLERAVRYAMGRMRLQADLKERDARMLIQERLASVGVLASGMAHEIGTPLGVIRGRSEVMLMKNRDQPGLKRDLEIIISQVDRISNLMRSLLNLARGDDSKRSGRVDLKLVVNEIIEVMATSFRFHEIAISNSIPDGVILEARAGSEPLHQVLHSLFQNSIEAIEEARRGGNAGPHSVRVSLADADESRVMTVSDSGCGIRAEDQIRLFRPFFSARPIGGGLGLGLALSQRIVQSWGGTISVESQFGKGAKFHLKFPKAP